MHGKQNECCLIESENETTFTIERKQTYFSTAVRTSDLSIFPPRFEARSIAPDFDIVQRTEICNHKRENGI